MNNILIDNSHKKRLDSIDQCHSYFHENQCMVNRLITYLDLKLSNIQNKFPFVLVCSIH